MSRLWKLRNRNKSLASARTKAVPSLCVRWQTQHKSQLSCVMWFNRMLCKAKTLTEKRAFVGLFYIYISLDTLVSDVSKCGVALILCDYTA
jgi:hypothetical protein